MLPCLGFWIACTQSFCEASVTVYQYDMVSYPSRCEFSSTPLREPYFSHSKDHDAYKITIFIELCKPIIFMRVFLLI